MIPELFNKITQNSTIIIGVSGGPDSAYLLFQCLELQKKQSVRIIVAHINHGLRGKESDLDELFVKRLAKRHKLPFESFKANLQQKKGNIEALGRNARYEFFEKLRKKHHAEWILTAHHLNDNIETALFNLIRGSSLSGIKGMSRVLPKKHILRPLLNISKAEILEFLKKKKIQYRHDQTNDDPTFSRNLLRLEIIPLIQKINSSFEKTFATNLRNFTEIAQFLEKSSKKWLKKNKPYNLGEFLAEPKIIQKNILAELYKKTYGSTKKLTFAQLEEILKVLNQKKANRKKEFGSKYFLKLSTGPWKKEKYFHLEKK